MCNDLNMISKCVLTGLKVQVGTFTSLKLLPLSPPPPPPPPAVSHRRCKRIAKQNILYLIHVWTRDFGGKQLSFLKNGCIPHKAVRLLVVCLVYQDTVLCVHNNSSLSHSLLQM